MTMKSHNHHHHYHDDEEEQHELLDKIDSQHHGVTTVTAAAAAASGIGDARPTSAAKFPRRNPFATWFVWLVFSILLCLFASSLFGFHHKDALRAVLSKLEDEQLAIKLHPSKHSTREPTTLTFDWNVTLGTRAPDGVEKQVYLINGNFPGPTIEARSGDRIVVNVHNGLDGGEGVSLHWHGLRMQGHNSMDGAVGVTQCPIPAGANFTYDFKIGNDEHGTFWWHSHTQLQQGDGLFGGFVIHKPRRDRHHVPHEEVLLLVGDWFHRKQSSVKAWYANPGSLGNEPVPDSILVNGRGKYNCSMAVPARPIKCKPVKLSKMKPLFRKRASRTRLRVVNTGTIAGISLKMDGATVRPIEVDGGCSVNAQASDSVGILYPGERVDLELDWKEAYTEHPWLSVYLDTENLVFSNPALNPNHTFPAVPKTLRAEKQAKAPVLNPRTHQDLTTLSSTTTMVQPSPGTVEQTILLYIKTEELAIYGNEPLGFINRTSWVPPARPLISQPRSSWDEHQLVPFIGTDSTPKRVILILNNLDDGSHPFHLHGYSFHVLATYRAEGRSGFGSYNPFKTPRNETLGSWNERPLRKDTIAVPRRGYAVISFMADNPGIWLMHCHMLVHMDSGMAFSLQVGNAGDEGHSQGLDASASQLCDAVR